MNRKIKYCVGLNGRPGNLESILTEKAKDIYEVYAACPSDIAPTGRRGYVPIDLKELRRQVELAHEYGVRYNVLMNGSCFGGLEFSRSFQEKISSFVKYLDDINADSTTVMNPFLIDIIRRNSQRIEIIASSFTEVTEPVKIARLKSRGADRIVLHQNVYRNFEMLKVLLKTSGLALEIIPNQGCVHQCENFISHINVVAHSSTATEQDIRYFGEFDTPIQKCRIVRQTDPIEFLMSCFIRPEDLGIYEEIGFNTFKFAGRGSSTEWMLNVIDAYVSRSYEGNIFDLSSHIGDHKKICELPNRMLDGWYRYMGSNSDCDYFRLKAIEFCRMKEINQYFPGKSKA